MQAEYADHYFKILVEIDDRELELLKEYKLVNDFLKLNDWLFISPIFFQGFEISTILRLSKTSGDHKQSILKLIQRKFYDLNYTASFIEGYCNRATYVQPFLKSIEHSLILCFQKDYEGSIKTIIPIIEGILRKYLTKEKGYSNEKIGYKHVKNSFSEIRLDLLKNYGDYLKNYTIENNIQVNFSEKQVANLLQRETEYLDVWFSFANDFFENSFYLNTSGTTITNEVNRHSILHEFGLDFEYCFENYIKIYFLLQFLTWVFLKKERKSILNNIESYRFLEKVYAYEKIIKISEALLYDKHILYKTYDNYNEQVLKEQFPSYQNKLLPPKMHLKHKFFREFGKKMWKLNIEK